MRLATCEMLSNGACCIRLLMPRPWLSILPATGSAAGHIAEGYDTLERLLGSAAIDGGMRAPLLRRAATFATIRDDYSNARRLNSEARNEYELLGDESGVAEATFNAAVVAQRVGDDVTAREEYTRALKASEAVGHAQGRALAIMNLSMMALSLTVTSRVPSSSSLRQLLSKPKSKMPIFAPTSSRCVVRSPSSDATMLLPWHAIPTLRR